jgi:hypothetical protein
MSKVRFKCTMGIQVDRSNLSVLRILAGAHIEKRGVDAWRKIRLQEAASPFDTALL